MARIQFMSRYMSKPFETFPAPQIFMLHSSSPLLFILIALVKHEILQIQYRKANPAQKKAQTVWQFNILVYF